MSKLADPNVSLTATTHPTSPAPSTAANMRHNSALPVFYWFVFGWYEPLLATGGALGALLYPEQVSSDRVWSFHESFMVRSEGVHPASTVAARSNTTRPAA